MALPININDLVHGNSVEWERLEFKQGWNPEDVIHSMCAFANDLQNWGGGYIILGIEENAGQPILPPIGLQEEQIDNIQKKILKLGYKIQPNYFPIVQPYKIKNEQILVLWCPAGDNRIYTAPDSLSNDNVRREAYVRIASNSIIARGETLRRLQELTARIPFDDRINNLSTINDLDLGLIQAHLQEVKSELYEESKSMSFKDLCLSMLIAKKGTITATASLNVNSSGNVNIKSSSDLFIQAIAANIRANDTNITAAGTLGLLGGSGINLTSALISNNDPGQSASVAEAECTARVQGRARQQAPAEAC